MIWIAFAPESLSPQVMMLKRSNATSSFHLLKTFKNMKLLLYDLKPSTASSPLPWIVIAYFLVFAVVLSNTSIVLIFLQHAFKADSDVIGYYLSTEGAVQTISMLFFPSLVNNVLKWQFTDITFILIAFICRYDHSIHHFLVAMIG